MSDTKKPGLAGPSRPLGSPEIPQFFLPAPAAGRATFAPRLYGAASIQFADRKRKIDESRRVAFLVPLDPARKTVDWDTAVALEVMPDQLLRAAPGPGTYLPLPVGARELNVFSRWAKQFDRWLARTQQIVLPPSGDPPEPTIVRPRRGGVSVELVAIVWELV